MKARHGCREIRRKSRCQTRIEISSRNAPHRRKVICKEGGGVERACFRIEKEGKKKKKRKRVHVVKKIGES